jgi:hypothetical protein
MGNRFLVPTVSPAGMTLLSTTTLNGATTTVSGISGDYKDLVVYIFDDINATADGQFRIAPNGTTNISRWYADDGNIGGDTVSVRKQFTSGYIVTSGGSTNIDRTSGDQFCCIKFSDYADTNHIKLAEWIASYNSTTTSFFINGIARIGTTSAITSLVFSNSGGNHSGGTVQIYGVK